MLVNLWNMVGELGEEEEEGARSVLQVSLEDGALWSSAATQARRSLRKGAEVHEFLLRVLGTLKAQSYLSPGVQMLNPCEHNMGREKKHPSFHYSGRQWKAERKQKHTVRSIFIKKEPINKPSSAHELDSARPCSTHGAAFCRGYADV